MIEQNRQIFPGGIQSERAIRLHRVSDSRYLVFTPFQMADGDHFTIVLKMDGKRWVLSDEGHTFMALSYHIPLERLESKKRKAIIENTCSEFGLSNWSGELVLPTEPDRFESDILRFGQALTHILDVTYLDRGRTQSTFKEELEEVVRSLVPAEILTADWHEKEKDPDRKYIVDFRIEAPRPIFLFLLNTSQNVLDATISLLTFNNWGLAFEAAGAVNPSANIPRSALSKFRDAPHTQSIDWGPSSLLGMRQFIQERTRLN